jgi:hypothetical protein
LWRALSRQNPILLPRCSHFIRTRPNSIDLADWFSVCRPVGPSALTSALLNPKSEMDVVQTQARMRQSYSAIGRI